MSNARNLANLLGTNTTVPRAKQPAGSVLQCVTTNYPNDFVFTLSASGTNGHMEVATGLNCSITPTSTSSKILYQATIYIGANLWYDIGYHVIKMPLQRLRLPATQIHPLAVVLIFPMQAAML